MSSRESQFVLDVLDMFEALRDFVLANGMPAGVAQADLYFAGFDGNHESKLLAYAEFFCTKQDSPRFQSIVDGSFDFNSHCPMAETYKRMLDAWKELQRPRPLAIDHVCKIVGARVYPDHE